VGGITIYQEFDLNLHPMRLQVDAKVGGRIMEYLWPARKARNEEIAASTSKVTHNTREEKTGPPNPVSPLLARSSLDSPRALEAFRPDSARLAPTPLRKLSVSRSFTDLRKAASDSPPLFERTRSSDIRLLSSSPESFAGTLVTSNMDLPNLDRKLGDAAEMKTRSSQKTFVLVRISR
jgi:hypothetical protein